MFLGGSKGNIGKKRVIVEFSRYSLDREHKLNVYKTFRRRSEQNREKNHEKEKYFTVEQM